VRAAGICHSVGFIDGTLTWMLANLPLVLGHEVAGVVSDIGPDVAGFELGDRIAAFGHPQHSPGYSVDGGFADKYLAGAEGLMKLPDAVDFVQAATATDAGQTAHGAVMGAGKVRADERVGIVGLGGLGLTGAQELGVREIDQDASELAGLDLAVIVDFAGFGTTTANAIAAVRPAGRVIQVGLGSTEATIPISQLVLKAVTLRGARGGRPRDFETVIDLIAKGDLSIHATTTTFEEIPQAIERLKNGDVLGRIVAVLD
jgi:propanol-preferring alcohol dehydrogenase